MWRSEQAKSWSAFPQRKCDKDDNRKIKALENTVVEVITDEDSETEVESIVVAEKKEEKECQKPVL